MLYDYIQGFIIVQIGLSLGFYMSSLVYASIHIQDEKYVPEKKYIDKYPIIPNKYEDKIDTRPHNNNEKQYNSNKCVYEYTPNGGIFLKYNSDENMFEYWGDSCIPYDILCVAMRKYCILFCVQKLYIDKGEEIEENKKIEKEEDDIFFTKPKPNKLTRDKTATDPSHKQNDNEINKNLKKHNIPNIQIKCKGAIRDFDILGRESTVKNESTEIITWSAYKKIQGSNVFT